MLDTERFLNEEEAHGCEEGYGEPADKPTGVADNLWAPELGDMELEEEAMLSNVAHADVCTNVRGGRR